MNKLSIVSIFLLAGMLTSCEVIGDIFSAGVYTGVFLVVLVIIIIVVIIARIRR